MGGSLIVRAGAREANRQDGREPNRQGGCAGGESSGRAGSVCWRTLGVQKAPRMPKRLPEGGCQKASNGTPKPYKNESVFQNRFRMPPRVPTRTLCPSFWLHFGSILGAKIVNFSCCFLASFLDAFLEAFGCIFGVILDGFWMSFLVLFRTL